VTGAQVGDRVQIVLQTRYLYQEGVIKGYTGKGKQKIYMIFLDSGQVVMIQQKYCRLLKTNEHVN